MSGKKSRANCLLCNLYRQLKAAEWRVIVKWKKKMAVICIMAMVCSVLLTPQDSMAATKKKVGNVKINITNLMMSKGQKKKLKLSGTKKKVKWKSSNQQVATVTRGGTVRGKKAGTAKITGRAGKKKVSCLVSVTNPKGKSRSLVLYFSHSGTTKKAAQRIKNIANADILRIVERDKYPSDYEKTTKRAVREIKKKSYPAVSTQIMNLNKYDTIYLGFPIWDGTVPRVVETFLRKNNWKSKTIAPFCTSGGSGIGKAAKQIKKRCKGAKVLSGLVANEGTSAEVKEWLQKIGLLSDDTPEKTPSAPEPTPTPPETPEIPETPDVVQDGLVYLSGGTFTMGSPESERLRGTDETAHEVSINPFYMDPYEVTQKDYQAVMGENPSHFSGEELPVENVTWQDAIRYCNRKSESEGLTPVYEIDGNKVSWNRAADGYRLPTEAEWEYAARAGTDTEFYTGHFISAEEANYYGTYPYLIEENYVHHTNPDVVAGQYRGTTVAGEALQPNYFHLYNMLGNVSEWVFDGYGGYDTEHAVNPAGQEKRSLRVNRGGAWNDFAKHLRCAYRSVANPKSKDRNLGFRIARNAVGIKETVVTENIEKNSIPSNPKILVVYFSHTGNTERAAKMIQEKTGGDLHEITMASPYSGSLYEETQKDLYAYHKPELSGAIENMDQYDVILLGYAGGIIGLN